MDKEMQRALEADGEKLRQMTGLDHGPSFEPPCDFPQCECCEIEDPPSGRCPRHEEWAARVALSSRGDAK